MIKWQHTERHVLYWLNSCSHSSVEELPRKYSALGQLGFLAAVNGDWDPYSHYTTLESKCHTFWRCVSTFEISLWFEDFLLFDIVALWS